MGLRNLQDALERYGKDDFNQHHPYSYILVTEPHSVKSSPVYKTLDKTVRNKNFDNSDDKMRSHMKSRVYVNMARNMKRDLSAQEIALVEKLVEIEHDKKQKISLEDFKTLWSYIRNHRPESQVKYQESARLIGKKAGLPMEFVIEETTFSVDKNKQENEEENETRDRYDNY